jgi:hypothetical protein
MARRWLMDEWRDGFLTQARLLEVPGPAIGEALAEVETHCADSGERPDQAFGAPDAYARALARGLRTPTRSARRARSLLLAASALAGIFLLLAGASAVPLHEPARITAGDLVSVVLGALAVSAIVDLGLAVRARGSQTLVVGACLGGFVAAVLPRLLWRQPLTDLPVAVALGAGVLLLLAGWWPLAQHHDRVVDPRTGREPFRVPRLALLLLRALPPVLVAGAMLVTILLPSGR